MKPTRHDPVDRSRPPAAGALRPAAPLSFETRRLSNGLRLWIARQPDFPLTDLELLVPAGAERNPLDMPGLAHLHGELLDEGCGERSALQVAQAAERIGTHLSTGAGWRMAYAEYGMMSQWLEPALELLAEVARQPRFDADEVERLRQEAADSLLRRRTQPAALAEETLASVIYRGTPYQHPLLGTSDSLPRLDQAAVLDFHRRHFHPDQAHFLIVGDVDSDLVADRCERLFGDWPRAGVEQAPAIVPEILSAPQVHIVDRPGAAQTQLLLGHPCIARADDDFHALMLGNTVLGGKFTSRINLNLRERHGYTYGARSELTPRRGPGPFRMLAAVATDVAGAAVGELLSELRRLRQEPISADELREAQDYLIGVFPYTLQSVSDLTRKLEAVTSFGLDEDYYERYPAVLADLDSQQVQAAIRRHLHPDRLAIVAVGPADTLRAQLADFGDVTVR